jgi:hypothetical protein
MKLFLPVVWAVWLTSLSAARAQAPVIQSFSANGVLVCTNLAAGSTASVEWASSLAGPWHTNWAGLDAVVVSTNGTITVGVPMFYRVRGTAPSTNPPAAPQVVTTGASALTGTTATLNGSVNPGGASTTGWFRYATTSPGSANDTSGTRVPASGGSALGAGNSAVPYSLGITGLTPGTTYYYWAIAQNSLGTSFGAVVSFFTPLPPTVVTASASSVSNTSATLNGSGTPNGASTTGWFRYSTSNPGTANDTAGTRVPASGGTALGLGYSAIPFAQAITGLSPGTTYYFWAMTTSSEGTAFGAVLSFTTN